LVLKAPVVSSVNVGCAPLQLTETAWLVRFWVWLTVMQRPANAPRPDTVTADAVDGRVVSYPCDPPRAAASVAPRPRSASPGAVTPASATVSATNSSGARRAGRSIRSL